MVKNHKGKHIWSQDAGVTKKDLKKMDMNNPDVDALVKGDISKVHGFVQPVMPPGEMFVHIRERRDRMFAKVGAHGATRGEITTSVATTNQISREADFTKNDDLVNDTILHVATESIKARMHMMKLRYTEEHFSQMAGKEEGEYLHLRITNDSIDDGMEVIVKASTTDKLRAERNAQNMAQLQMIEPFYYYKDLGIPDAEGRAEAVFLFNSNPALWYEKVVKGNDISAIANQITGVAPPMAGQPPMEQPMMGQAPMQPSPQNTSNVATQPQGSPQGLVQRATSAVGGAINNVRGRIGI